MAAKFDWLGGVASGIIGGGVTIISLPLASRLEWNRKNERAKLGRVEIRGDEILIVTPQAPRLVLPLRETRFSTQNSRLKAEISGRKPRDLGFSPDEIENSDELLAALNVRESA